jgi:hypothetical protein
MYESLELTTIFYIFGHLIWNFIEIYDRITMIN